MLEVEGKVNKNAFRLDERKKNHFSDCYIRVDRHRRKCIKLIKIDADHQQYGRRVFCCIQQKYR